MFKVVRFIALLTLSAVFITHYQTPSTTLRAQSSPSVPYIFYYSTLYNGFVVERADGTDTRIFGQGLSETPYVGGPGWSPSKTFFAWTTLPFEGPGFPLQRDGWLVNIQSNERMTWLDDFENFDALMWSPVEDVLLAVRAEYHDTWRDAYRSLYLIDIANDELITSFDFTDRRVATWSPDGQYVLLTGEETPHFSIILRDGSIDDRTPNDPKFTEQPTSAFWLNDGRLMSIDLLTNELVIENLESGEETRVLLPSSSIHSMLAPPDGRSDVILSSDDADWVFIPESTTFHAIHTKSDIAWYRQLMGDPYTIFDQYDVNLPNMALMANDGPLVDEVIEYARADSIEYILYVEQDTESPNDEAVWVYDVGDQTRTLISGGWKSYLTARDPKHELPIIGYFPPAYDRNAMWSPETLDVFVAESTGGVRFNVATGERETLDNLQGGMNTSPDGQTRFYHGKCPPLRDTAPPFYGDVSGLSCFWDLSTDETIPIRPHSHNVYNRTSLTIVYWHPSSDWAIVVSHVDVGGSGIPNYTLTNHDGTLIRDVTDSCRGQLCIQWLPDDIDIDLIAPTHLENPSPAPVTTFTGHDWLISAVAWSPDGTMIASAEEWGGITVWSVESGEILIPEFASDRTIYGLGWNSDGTILGGIVSSPQTVGDGEPAAIFPPSELVLWDVSDTTTAPTEINSYDETTFSAWEGDVLSSIPTLILQQNFVYAGDFDFPTRSYLVDTNLDKVIFVEGRVAVSQNGQWIAGISDEGLLTVTDLTTGVTVSEIQLELDLSDFSFQWAWNRLALSDDGETLAFAQFSDVTRIINTTNGETTLLYPSARGLSFSPDGTHLALAASYDVFLYDLGTE